MRNPVCLAVLTATLTAGCSAPPVDAGSLKPCTYTLTMPFAASGTPDQPTPGAGCVPPEMEGSGGVYRAEFSANNGAHSITLVFHVRPGDYDVSQEEGFRLLAIGDQPCGNWYGTTSLQLADPTFYFVGADTWRLRADLVCAFDDTLSQLDMHGY